MKVMQSGGKSAGLEKILLQMIHEITCGKLLGKYFLFSVLSFVLIFCLLFCIVFCFDLVFLVMDFWLSTLCVIIKLSLN